MWTREFGTTPLEPKKLLKNCPAGSGANSKKIVKKLSRTGWTRFGSWPGPGAGCKICRPARAEHFFYIFFWNWLLAPRDNLLSIVSVPGRVLKFHVHIVWRHGRKREPHSGWDLVVAFEVLEHLIGAPSAVALAQGRLATGGNIMATVLSGGELQQQAESSGSHCHAH